MYSAVNTSDYEFTDVIDMDDRESLYFDTISVAGSEPNRKSLSMSRQTIYHSAVDLPACETATTPASATKSATATTATTSFISSKNDNDNSKYQKNPTISPNIIINNKNGSSTIITNANNEFITNEKFKINNHINSSSINNSGAIRPSSFLRRQSSTQLDVGDYRDDNVAANAATAAGYNYGKSISETWRQFEDGKRSVDFVLAYNGNDNNPIINNYRKILITNLINSGLEIEHDETQKTHFIKIHAPIDVLRQYCEILKIKLPIIKMKEQDEIIETEFELMTRCKIFFGRPFRFVKLDTKLFPPKEYRLMLEYSSNYDYLFDTNDVNLFNTSRSMTINFILERISCKGEKHELCGLEDIIKHGVIDAAYPLHDGDIDTDGSQRKLLLNEWASCKKFMKHQPLDNIKDYFGVKVALYFAWLGFYTHMLIPASIIGLICFFYGVFTLSSDRLSQDICNENNTIIMCPLCDVKCDYWYLKQTCIYSKVNYLFDNKLTIFFAFFMSFWAVLYLELWKRYSANLIHRWGLTDYTPLVEYPRTKYLERVRNIKHKQFNVIHKVLEPRVPFWKYKFPVHFATFSTVFLFICLALSAIFGSIVYRMSQSTSRNIYGTFDSTSYKIMATPITAAIIDLIIITILDYCYNYLAEFLTNLEYRRSQADYDESLSLKIYMFQFINYYSSLFYIAFIKGKFVGYPAKYNRIFNLRQEECNPGGCLMELCIQLIIIMIGKQAINALLEMLLPYLIKTFKTIKQHFGTTSYNYYNDGRNDELIPCNQWTEDYKLLPWTTRDLFNEYLEMVLQFGFITIFVVAFPLAPLFALCNNVMEMRLDAKKYLTYYRRPVPQRVKDIGVWYNVLSVVSRIAVAASAFIIAFSTNFIPKLVYMTAVNTNNHTDEGYLNHTLAYFNVEDFQEGTRPILTKFKNVTTCRYSEYRNPPWSPNPYKRPLIYWHILAARLAFFVVFQNVVGVIQTLVAWAIPDVPGKLRNKIKREEYLTREAIIDEETRRRIREHERDNGYDDDDGKQQQQQQHDTRLENGNQLTKRKQTNSDNNNTEREKGGKEDINIKLMERNYIDNNERDNNDNDADADYDDRHDILRKRYSTERYVDRTTPV